MLSIAYYFLQVSLCSAVMMLYYALVLRNKRFHQYNRFYLLGVAVLPWLMPLVKIDINKPKEAVSIPIQLFSVIADTNSEFEKTVADKGFQFTWETLVATMYIAVSGVLLTMLLIAMAKIYKLLKTNSCKNLDDVYLVLTQANGTPFSFFKFIFWHTDIDATTTAGKQMLQHELTHVREKHSLDKLLLQIVLIIGWANPIFWLLKRELETIHEFIADNKAIDNGDTAALATMLLAAAYPQQRFALTNPFFYSPIKRRIAMLTNNKHPRFSYARRLVVLPLLVTVTLLFAFRKKEAKPITLSVASALENVVGTIADVTNTADCLPVDATNAKLTKTYTVVIDAGHGGTDAGAPGIDGKSFEKDIALSIAKLVKAQNANANINIVLTRDNDVFMSPVQKADYANKANADLFLSVHCNSADPIKTNNGYKASPARGYEVVIPSKERPGMEDCKLLASTINSVFNSSSFAVGQVVQKQKTIWVLQATNCPATLVECGYMSNQDDLKALKNTANQQEIATNILKGIETYLVSKENKNEIAILKNSTTVENGATTEELAKYDAFVEKFNPNTGNGVTDADREWLFSIYQKMTSEQKETARISYIITPKIIKKVPTKEQWNEWLTKDRNTVSIDNKLVSKTELTRYTNTDFIGYADYDVLKKGFENPSSLMNNVYLFTKVNFKKANEEYSKRKWLETNIYGGEKVLTKTVSTKKVDTLPEKKVTVTNGSKKVTVIGKSTTLNGKMIKDAVAIKSKKSSLDSVLIIVAGKKITKAEMEKINPSDIKSVTVIKDKTATEKYGEEGKNGVIEIELKKEGDVLDDNKVFSEVQISAEFPGGVLAWKKYLERNLKIPEEAKTKNAPSGTYSVEVAFTVHEDGFISNVKALTDPGYGTADAAIALIKKGPKWQPAVQNGVKVTSIKKQKITFVIGENPVSISNRNDKTPLAAQFALPAEIKKFQDVSNNIFEVFWIGSSKNLFININHKNGFKETYDLFDENSKKAALTKYNEDILFSCKHVLKVIEEKKRSLKS